MRKFLMTASVFAVATSAAMASTQSVINSESIVFNNVNSWDAQGDLDNEIIANTMTGGFTANSISWSGNLDNSTGNAATWASEADILFNGPNIVLNPSSNGAAYTPPEPVGGSTTLPTPFDPASIVSFEFFESFDDTADAIDQTWLDLTLTFEESVVTNGNFSAGALSGTTTSLTGNNVAGGLDFYTFTIGGAGVDATGFLNIQTYDIGGTLIDTELGLYDSAGNFIATDDDGQDTALGGLYSMLSFGASDPLTGTDTAPGADGATLPAGTYTVVVGGFNTLFEPNINDIVPGSSAGDYGIDLTFVPEPASLGLMLLGFAGLVRRR